MRYDRYISVGAAMISAALCISGCNSKEPEEAIAEDQTSVHDESRKEPEIPSEEEQIRTVYQNSLESTFCIFTPGGNNGTGFLYNDTYVITNAHVLYDTDQFTLMDAEKNEYTGTVVFTDYETDIAVIQADQIHGKSVRLGNSDDVRSGDRLILIGNPADGEPFSFCTGERLKPVDFVQQMDQEGLYIPSDADLRSGYSGGPVFNLSGELIGISNAAFTGDLSEYGLEHLSLIIPINRVRKEIEENCAD